MKNPNLSDFEWFGGPQDGSPVRYPDMVDGQPRLAVAEGVRCVVERKGTKVMFTMPNGSKMILDAGKK